MTVKKKTRKKPGRKKGGKNKKPRKTVKRKRLTKAEQEARKKGMETEAKALAAYGRPREYLDAKGVENIELMAARCLSEQDIATLSGIGLDTLKTHFQEPIKRGRAKMRDKLLSNCFQLAVNGNVTAQIWLMKQDAIGLHFTDKLRTEQTGKEGGPIEFKDQNTSVLWEVVAKAGREGRLTEEQRRRIGWSQPASHQ